MQFPLNCGKTGGFPIINLQFKFWGLVAGSKSQRALQRTKAGWAALDLLGEATKSLARLEKLNLAHLRPSLPNPTPPPNLPKTPNLSFPPPNHPKPQPPQPPPPPPPPGRPNKPPAGPASAWLPAAPARCSQSPAQARRRPSRTSDRSDSDERVAARGGHERKITEK